MSKRMYAIGLTFVLLASAATAQAALVDGGFEGSAPGLGWPSTYGAWVGDKSTVVGTHNGINPLEGSQMLQFLAAGRTAGRDVRDSEMGQLIDLTPEQASGSYTADLSGWFNRVTGNSRTDTEFRLGVYAMTGSPSNAQRAYGSGNYLDSAIDRIQTSGDVWEQASTSMLIPAGTDYLMVVAMARENVFNNGRAPEFDGHYADQLTLNITGDLGDDDGGPRAELVYDWSNGEVLLQSISGHSITSFLLQSPGDFQENTTFPEDWANVDTPYTISYTDLDGGGFDSLISLGQILPAHIGEADLLNNVLLTSEFYVDGTDGPYDFEIDVINLPEPMTMSLLATGGLAVLLRRRRA